MTSSIDFELSESSPLTQQVRRVGFDRFLALAEYVQQLPYGRPSDIEDLLAVLKEKRGTCSFKHRLLAAVAHECGRTDIDLVVGLYAMSEQNTCGVGAVLAAAGVASLPEAHCYLRVNGERYDFTGLKGAASSPFEALISEHVVAPARLSEEKARLHQGMIRTWAASQSLPFADAWGLREACIQALGSNNTSRLTGSSASLMRVGQ